MHIGTHNFHKLRSSMTYLLCQHQVHLTHRTLDASTKSGLGFKYRFLDWLGSGCLHDCSENVSFPRHHQSFRHVSWKAIDNCIRTANKSPKMPHSTMLREVEKCIQICIQDHIITKSKSITPISITLNHYFCLIVLTDKHTNRIDYITSQTSLAEVMTVDVTLLTLDRLVKLPIYCHTRLRTRSSAIAEKPCKVSCHGTFC